ncbi:MAG TPA: hypothetical protein DEQ47_00505 [Solibacterales bacterium]|nr:hypothetical protein [Bryobacterales bacterium]
MLRNLFILFPLICSAPSVGAVPPPSFESTVQPFLAKHCAMCHNDKAKVGGLSVSSFHTGAEALEKRDALEHIERRLKTGEMPPKGMPRPPQPDIDAVVRWIDSSLEQLDKNVKPDPGRLTAHRLNRFEYNNTIHDLLGIDFKPARDFPADDAGYGFDNIGDVLSISPVLMEKYLVAATRISRRAIQANDPLPKPSRERENFDRTKLNFESTEPTAFVVRHKFENEADYTFHVGTGGPREPLRVTFMLDRQVIGTQDVYYKEDEQPRVNDFKVRVPAGEHWLVAVLEKNRSVLRPLPMPPRLNTPPQVKPGKVAQGAYVDNIELRGPYNPLPTPISEAHKRIFVCSEKTPECARVILTRLASLAWRRPADPAAVARLVQLASMARTEGDTFEQGIRLGLQAILVAPQFLFRIERDPNPHDATHAHRVDDYELASRLSYFLWSSMPDQTLFKLAAAGRLHEPAVEAAQVRRMMLDKRSERFVENFAGQWLQLRNLDSIKPDPDKFPEFDAELRAAMKTETRMFFEAVLREDRSVLDFLDGRYTFLNERLAKFYGIPGVTGKQFRRVELTTPQRSGVLTQASILTVSSYPTRTSPVIRGKWVLENFLNDPPPPPPPGVPNLDEKAAGTTASLRQQLEKHRASPVCASCHNRMDPLGFGLENYNAIGKWRTQDGNFPVDTSGTLPNGKSFNTPEQLKATLKADSGRFTECLTDKLLTYALGRGLERYDKPTVKSISSRLAKEDYKFSSLILDVVNSMPFQMRRGEGELSNDTQASAKTHVP